MADTLRVENLSAQLGQRAVLQDVSLEAAFGEITAVLGPNGAGKSTLLRAIGGLVRHSGRILLGDKVLSQLAPYDRAKQLSFVPQHSQLAAAMPVRDVVMQGRYVHRQGRASQAHDADAVQQAMHMSDVLSLAERPFTQLSFGEQRRVLLARALATGARVVLLDEPSAAFDIAHALHLHALLKTLAAQGRCIVVVLHDLDEVLAHTTRAVLLQEGRVKARGATRDVLSAARVREVYGVEVIEAGGLGFRLPTGAV